MQEWRRVKKWKKVTKKRQEKGLNQEGNRENRKTELN